MAPENDGDQTPAEHDQFDRANISPIRGIPHTASEWKIGGDWGELRAV